MTDTSELFAQAGKALLYYAALVGMMRLAGKRLAGQTTTFDLIVLISLGVVIQSAALEKGVANAAVFAATVFSAHRLQALASARWPFVRRLVRGRPRALVREGEVLPGALREEGITLEELLAGLRKLGYDGVEPVKLAVLEETGHISAVGRREAGPGPPARTPDRRVDLEP